MVRDQAFKLRELVNREPFSANKTVASKRNTRILAITSGKGGVGKSNLAANLAIALAHHGNETIVFDADLGMANVDILMGLTPKYNLQDVLYGRKELKDIMQESYEGVKIIPGASGLQEITGLGAQRQALLIENLQNVSEKADFLVIDTGAGIHRNVLAFLGAAQEVIIVSTTEPTSLKDAYGILKILVNYGDQREIKTVINRVANIEDGERTFRKLQVTAEKFLNFDLKNLGCIREDKMLIKAVQEQEPLILKYPFSDAAIDIKEVAGKILNTQIEKPIGTQRFFYRLQRLFG